VFLRPTFASAARQARSRCLAASSEREGAGTRYAELENGLALCAEHQVGLSGDRTRASESFETGSRTTTG